jgi:four helix bundle protein
MPKSLIQEKSFSFAVRIALYCRTHLSGKDDLVLSRQFLRASTSIGANVEEVLGRQSRKDFIAKLGIAVREAREAHYWLRLIERVTTDHHPESISLRNKCEELLKIFNSIILTTRRNSISSKPNSKLTTQSSELSESDSEHITQNSELLDGGGTP